MATGVHLGLLIKTMLGIFDLQVTQILPTKFQVNLHFGSGDEVQQIFLRLWPLRHFGFPIITSLASFDLQVTLILPTKFQVNWPLSSR